MAWSPNDIELVIDFRTKLLINQTSSSIEANVSVVVWRENLKHYRNEIEWIDKKKTRIALRFCCVCLHNIRGLLITWPVCVRVLSSLSFESDENGRVNDAAGKLGIGRFAAIAPTFMAILRQAILIN